MQYMLLIYEDETAYADGPQGEVWQTILKAHNAFGGALAQAGVIRAGAGLNNTASATTVRRTDGQYAVHDGPFAETREQLGGYYLIDVPDLDAAIGGEEGLAALTAVADRDLSAWLPWRAAQAHLLAAAGRTDDARAAYAAALALDPPPAERLFLERRRNLAT